MSLLKVPAGVRKRRLFMRSTLFPAALLAACAPAAAAPVPTTARAEPSGFVTIETAPPMPLPPKAAAAPSGLPAGRPEAVPAQEALRPAFERLLATVRKKEAGNFTDVRMIHEPGWAFVFYFKRDPERTLAKYTKEPRFKAAKARYSHKDLQVIAKPWVERFMAERLLTGHGTDATYGKASMQLVVSEAEYREIAERKGWGPVPDAIELDFSGGVQGHAVPDAVRPLIRIFAHSDRDLGVTNQALLTGRIVLRDGCFYVVAPAQPDRLAYFPREVGLSLDPQGYLALRSRVDGRLIGRVGEQFNWGGPIGLAADAPMVGDLRRQCGNAPIEHVGMLTSAAEFRRKYGV